jgi:hypothetical protein
MSETSSTNKLLSELIKKLEEVHLIEREILLAIQATAATRTEAGNERSVGTGTTEPPTTVPPTAFNVGDSVKVTNRIRRQPVFGSLGRRQEASGGTDSDTGVIVSITKKRIHIKVTGTTSIIQRDPANVELIDPSTTTRTSRQSPPSHRR